MDDKIVNLRVDNCSTSITGNIRGEVYKEFKRFLGYQPEDYLWKQKRFPHWDGYETTVCYSKKYCKCAIKRDGTHFPTGLFSKAKEFLEEKGYTINVIDTRDPEIASSYRSLNYSITSQNDDGTPFALHDYQKDAVQRAVNQQRGIIKIATGGGKTLCAAGVIAALGVAPAIFYVTSKDLLDQAVSEIQRFVRLDGLPIDVGMVGAGHKKIRDVTVMTVQTAVRAVGQKYVKSDSDDETGGDDDTDISDIKKDVADLIQSAKLIICDEVQHWAADTCQVIADHSISCRWRYGLSATPWRDKGDDILIDGCFGRPIVDINASWLIQNGFLVKPYIAFIPVDNMKKDKLGSWPSVYKYAVVENEYRNQLISKLAQNLVNKGRTVLILIQHISHGERLSEIIPNSVFLHGSHSSKIRQEHIERMRSGHAPVTIASTIFDEGIDVRPLDALILAGGGKSATRALQRIGRVIRKYNYPDGRKKENAFVYDMLDHQEYLTDHAGARRRIYRSEPEFEIRDATI